MFSSLPANRPHTAALLLRLGLGLVLLYAAIGAFAAPDDWVGYLPRFVAEQFDEYLLLKLFGVYQIGLVVWLASGRYMRWAGLACAATFGGIVLANLSLLLITFRDVAMVFAALALAVLAEQPPARKVDVLAGKP